MKVGPFFMGGIPIFKRPNSQIFIRVTAELYEIKLSLKHEHRIATRKNIQLSAP